eukprot:CAMPEP_0202023314 /NCGR_PEP_ID=MMETSP0905-20130828/51601_1 /ASSEMBLY_ACC=CAM_ASM_000554 /TAXON_ID=420261 /ORGANISM="Thalassiosira antarctica, Strain CCMP982" /LENGTH=229 /DNA_ID=CAMNT_0048585669 /DNA_START=21 /DNA_END=706 /DNA_ORIENTATION=-
MSDNSNSNKRDHLGGDSGRSYKSSRGGDDGGERSTPGTRRTVAVSRSTSLRRQSPSASASIELGATPPSSASRRLRSPLGPSSVVKVDPISRTSDKWQDSKTTCLSIGLRPIDDREHAAIICNGCRDFSGKLKGDLENHDKKKRSRRNLCKRPWEIAEKTTEQKKDTSERIYAVFAPVGNVSTSGNNDGIDKTVTAPETPVIASVEAQSLIRSEMSPRVLLSTRCLDQP